MSWKSYKSYTVSEIAEYMGKSEVFVRKSIENGSLPIGCYVRQGTKGSYYISPKRAWVWLGYVRNEENTDGYSTPLHDECDNGSSG